MIDVSTRTQKANRVTIIGSLVNVVLTVLKIIAGISGFNTGSMKFHSNNGFRECGRFIGVGRKFGREFDVVWMQKRLSQ